MPKRSSRASSREERTAALASGGGVSIIRGVDVEVLGRRSPHGSSPESV